MTILNRRSFFKIGIAGLAGGALIRPGITRAEPVPANGMPRLTAPQTPAELHIGCQQMLVPGATFEERYDFLEANGYDRVEINGGKWDWLAANADAMAAAIKGRKLRFCVTCIGARGNSGMADPAERRAVIDTTKSIVESAGKLGAVGVIMCPARKQIDRLTALGFGNLPVCMAKTQYSFSDDAAKLGAPEHFTVTIRNVKVSAGAGFIVALTGDIMTMPGLPKVPAAERIDVDENGVITGLY